MYWVGCTAVGEFGAGKVETEAIGAWQQVHQGLEVRLRHGPGYGRKSIVEATNGESTVQRLLRGVANGTVYDEYLLVNLDRKSASQSFERDAIGLDSPSSCH